MPDLIRDLIDPGAGAGVTFFFWDRWLKYTELALYFLQEHMPSSVVAHMKYDAARQSLRIWYVSGLVYEYKNVPEAVYRAMKTSGSKGTYLNRHIKGHYAFEKINA